MYPNNRFGWFKGDLVIQDDPVAKGDYVGHPFRGNQWTDSTGSFNPNLAIKPNNLNFNPFGAESKQHSEQDRRDERIEFSANASVAFGDIRRADIMKLHQLRGVGVVEIDTPTDRFNPKRYINVVRIGGYDTSMVLIKSPQHQTREAAERAKPKVQAALEKFFANPTLNAKPIDKDIWEYEWVIPEGEPMAGRTATRRVSFVKPQYPDQTADVIKFAPSFVIKGDFVGHPFRGNQWSDSTGASTGAMSSASPASPDLSGVSTQIDTLLQENDAADALHDEFIKDHWGAFMDSIEKLGYKRTERSVVVVDGKEHNLNYDGARGLPADHPISVLHDKYAKEETSRRNEYFTAIDSLAFGSFDIADGLSVYDKARQIVLDKVANGIYYHDGADNTRMAIEFDVRSELDRKAMVRYVVDEGCTGPTGIGKGATGVNDAIRQGKNPAFAKQIDKSMLISNRPLAVFRGASLPKGLIDAMTVGSSYTERGFMSTAPQRHTAEFYAEERHKDKLGGADSRIVIFRMLLPKGTKANPMGTDEIVVARNSTIRVASKQDVTDPKLGPITVIDAVVEQ
jgi:hypothetical protein